MLKIVITTSIGELVAQIDELHAPETSAFFLDLVNNGFYNSGDIYRVSQLGIEDGPPLIQGGSALPYLQNSRLGKEAPMLDRIETTSQTGLQHHRGTLSLARDLGRTGHALAEFFICLGDFPSLDESGRDLHDTQGFPAFGEVIKGLELLDALALEETNGDTHSPLLSGQMLTTPVNILRIEMEHE